MKLLSLTFLVFAMAKIQRISNDHQTPRWQLFVVGNQAVTPLTLAGSPLMGYLLASPDPLYPGKCKHSGMVQNVEIMDLSRKLNIWNGPEYKISRML